MEDGGKSRAWGELLRKEETASATETPAAHTAVVCVGRTEDPEPPWEDCGLSSGIRLSWESRGHSVVCRRRLALRGQPQQAPVTVGGQRVGPALRDIPPDSHPLGSVTGDIEDMPPWPKKLV